MKMDTKTRLRFSIFLMLPMIYCSIPGRPTPTFDTSEISAYPIMNVKNYIQTNAGRSNSVLQGHLMDRITDKLPFDANNNKRIAGDPSINLNENNKKGIAGDPSTNLNRNRLDNGIRTYPVYKPSVFLMSELFGIGGNVSREPPKSLKTSDQSINEIPPDTFKISDNQILEYLLKYIDQPNEASVHTDVDTADFPQNKLPETIPPLKTNLKSPNVWKRDGEEQILPCVMDQIEIDMRFREHFESETGNPYLLECLGKVTVNKCEGMCSSSVVPNVNHYDGFQRECACCKDITMSTRDVTLTACVIGEEDVRGYSLTRSIVEPTSCSCQECSRN